MFCGEGFDKTNVEIIVAQVLSNWSQNCLGMIKAQFLISQHFLNFDIIKKLKNVISGNPHPLTSK